MVVVVLGVGWNVADVRVMLGRAGWNTWRWLGCTWRFVENKPRAYFLR